MPAWSLPCESIRLALHCTLKSSPTAVQSAPQHLFQLSEFQTLLGLEWRLACAQLPNSKPGPGLVIDSVAGDESPGTGVERPHRRLWLDGQGLVGEGRARLDCLPFETDSVDWIVVRHVFEFINEDSGLDAELARILAPGGYLLVFGLNRFSFWRFWSARRARPGMCVPRLLSVSGLRRRLARLDLDAGNARYFGGGWPHAVDRIGAAGASGRAWQGAWMLPLCKQALTLRLQPWPDRRRQRLVQAGMARMSARRIGP